MHNIFDNEQLRAVLFDMDGVLFDSMPNHASSWTRAVERYGLSMTRKEVYMNEGRTGSGTINTLAQRRWGRDATEEEVQRIYEAKSEFFNQCPKAQPMPFAREVIEEVQARGLTRVIVTGSGQVSLLERLNEAFPEAFSEELMVTAFDVKLGKPHAEPYLKGLAKAGWVINDDHAPLLPSQAIVVENAPLGIQAAKAAGIFCVAVNTGPLEDQILLDAGADIIFPSMRALAEYLS